MTARDTFNHEQWQTLIDTPALIGAAVMVVSRSGAVGTTKEAFAVTRGLLDAPAEYEHNTLVNEIVEHRTSGGEGSLEWQSRYQGSSSTELEREVLKRCRETAELLKAIDAHQASECKAWMHAVGVRVAKAAAEGGFLGFGGERVSAEEDRLLTEIAIALGLPSAS